MLLEKLPASNNNDEQHVFRMIGASADVVSSCKATMAAHGFGGFISYGQNFVCSKSVEGAQSAVVVYVESTMVHPDLYQISFRKSESRSASLLGQLVHKKLERVKGALERKAA